MNHVDVVDAQAHLFFSMDDRQALAAMDALGIRSLLIDEYWGYDAQGRPGNGFDLRGGIRRRVHPLAERASFAHPDRFAYLVKLTRTDPLLHALVELAADHPHVRAIRVDIRSPEEVRQLRDGGYSDFFRTVQRHGLPLFLLLPPDTAPAATRALNDHPALPIVLDHCGMASGPDTFQDVLELAHFPNAMLKWCHAPSKLSRSAYPFADAIPQLHRALDAFGRERILWASDFTAVRAAPWPADPGFQRPAYTWAESLFYLRHADALSLSDKQWILGGTARRLLAWPLPASEQASVGASISITR